MYEVQVTQRSQAISTTTEEDIRDFAITIADVLADTPANHTRVMDIRSISTLADFFVISSGENERQLRAITRQLTEELASRQARPSKIEGDAASGWILIDYGDVVVHVFSDELRSFYNLEELWQDAPVVLDIQ
ncbi:MAG: ribosome silencing factor [Chloroflexia bacterium]|nr:ribosome silencing factor [Chloroflexia bacterium]